MTAAVSGNTGSPILFGIRPNRRTRQATEAQLESLGFVKAPTQNGSPTRSFTKTGIEDRDKIQIDIPNIAPGSLLSRNAAYEVREAMKQARLMDEANGRLNYLA